MHIDDDQDFLDLFRITFYKRIDIISSLEVQTAFQLLRSKPFDAVVTDYEMPQMDRLDFLRLLKDEFPDVPLIFYTGQGNEEIARKAFVQGASDYFTKDLTGFAYKEKIFNSIKKAAEITNLV